MMNNRCFCNWTGSQRNDDSDRCGWQWDCHSGGMGERRHEQRAITCSAWTEGDRTNTWLHIQQLHFPTTSSVSLILLETLKPFVLYFQCVQLWLMFSFYSAYSCLPLAHRWQRGMGSISGGWSTLTSRPTVVCVRACCSASGNKDSAAPVRVYSRHQRAAMDFIHSTNEAEESHIF